jgi:hypothetical protein
MEPRFFTAKNNFYSPAPTLWLEMYLVDLHLPLLFYTRKPTLSGRLVVLQQMPTAVRRRGGASAGRLDARI